MSHLTSLPWTLILLALASYALPTAVASGGDPMHVHDSAHMFSHMEHLSIKPKDGKELSEAEQEYYYFKMHDFDNNNKLDGLELMKSMLDHDEGKQVMSDTALEQAINEVLKDEDANGDGYIDYSEFVASQRKTEDPKSA
ncbi:hypothetical protein BOX15_Mlig032881g2 [Macrostomum lignano]|uniref:EF-hand domain-containing protein n=1 Tax=Macrostomum lignano TaxID=282301 RepID=A0A267GEM1_9PLAT|nr:hypothetical protein BOX15_Mlig032881g2 [Macrostomum lignano]